VRPAHADGQIWLTAQITASVAKSWRLSADFHPRWEGDAGDFSRFVVRGAVGRALSRRWVVTAGYEFIDSHSRLVREERRLWQQAQFTTRTGRWTLAHRARIEERSLQLARSTVVRARYQLRVARPLGQTGQWSWIAGEELFYTVRGSELGPEQGFDRNRAGAGIARQLSSRVTLETGYQFQYINRPPPLHNQADHLFQTFLQVRF
jgi:hypothetical protein